MPPARLGAIPSATLRRHHLHLRGFRQAARRQRRQNPVRTKLEAARTPSASSTRTPSRNRTGLRTWRTQYSALHSSSLVARRPVTLLAIGRRGVPQVTDDTTFRNSSSIGCMRCE